MGPAVCRLRYHESTAPYDETAECSMVKEGSHDGPRFSVLVPAYNARETIQDTLDGMLAQQYADWECVVVDDGSTDETAAFVDDYCFRDSRFKLVRQENRGCAGAYRTAYETSQAPLLVICAADDYLLPAHLKTMDALVTRSPGYQIFSSNGEYLYHDSGVRRPVYDSSEWSKELSLSFEDVIAVCFYSVGVVIRREAYELVGGHRHNVYTDDYDLWLRAMARGARHKYTPEVLSVHRVSSFQQSANLARLYESNLEVYANLLATESLDQAQVTAVQRAVASTRQQLDSTEPAVAADLEGQARRLRETVEKVVGTGRADGVMRFIHSFSSLSRPLRRWMAAIRHRES